MRRYPFETMENLRDLGGYPKKCGGMTPFGRLFRSAAPTNLLPSEVGELRSLGITCVIDLRGVAERTAYPNTLADQEGFEVHHIPLIPEDYDYSIMDYAVPDMYFFIATNAPAMARVFRAIGGAKGGVLFHCAVGKDRTGIVSALLLRMASVDDLDIVADYQVSATYLRPMIERSRASYGDAPMSWWQSNAEYMDGFLKLFDEKFPSVFDYLRFLNLSDREIADVERKLKDDDM